MPHQETQKATYNETRSSAFLPRPGLAIAIAIAIAIVVV
jgi:hypothetical protein